MKNHSDELFFLLSRVYFLYIDQRQELENANASTEKALLALEKTRKRAERAEEVGSLRLKSQSIMRTPGALDASESGARVEVGQVQVKNVTVSETLAVPRKIQGGISLRLQHDAEPSRHCTSVVQPDGTTRQDRQAVLLSVAEQAHLERSVIILVVQVIASAGGSRISA